ncbi:MAG TPA: Crp/Fnr family transcriptional regulator [Epulopiscium sp.]|nr:Crp/Fnr family transcriptional regulator [Candidatus Epulonipiscium sp.]
MYEDWLKMLQGTELFKDIDPSELTKILRCSNPSIKQYKKREIITMEKSDFTGIGLVLEGEVTLTKDNLAGDRLIIAKIKTGDIFGEISAFVDQNWLETVTARTDCQILFISPDRIIGMCPHMCTGHRILIQNTLHLVSQKAYVLHKKVEMLSLSSIRKKISTYLLEQYYMTENRVFQIPLKRNELAEYLHIQRPSLSRELANMQDEGIIEFQGNTFQILELELLKECL